MTFQAPESCHIPPNDPVFSRYHDLEWGVPTVCDRAIFEKICLEGFQSGLSWQTILRRRPSFRQAFDDFVPERIANYTDSDLQRLMNDERIIRNRRKILSVFNNARRFAQLQTEWGSLAAFFWQFEPQPLNRPARVDRQWLSDNPFTPESEALSKALKKRGWTFVGPTNMYALMQALGIVNDHVEGCPRRADVEILRSSTTRPRLPHHR